MQSTLAKRKSIANANDQFSPKWNRKKKKKSCLHTKKSAPHPYLFPLLLLFNFILISWWFLYCPWKVGSSYRDCLRFRFCFFFFFLYMTAAEAAATIIFYNFKNFMNKSAKIIRASTISFFISCVRFFIKCVNRNNVNRLRGDFNCCKFTHFSEKGNLQFDVHEGKFTRESNAICCVRHFRQSHFEM